MCLLFLLVKRIFILTPGGSTMDGSSYSYKIKIKVQDLSYRRITGLTDLIGSLQYMCFYNKGNIIRYSSKRLLQFKKLSSWLRSTGTKKLPGDITICLVKRGFTVLLFGIQLQFQSILIGIIIANLFSYPSQTLLNCHSSIKSVT